MTSPDNPGSGKHWSPPPLPENDPIAPAADDEARSPADWLRIAAEEDAAQAQEFGDDAQNNAASGFVVDAESQIVSEISDDKPSLDQAKVSAAKAHVESLFRAPDSESKDQETESNYGPVERSEDGGVMDQIFEARELLDEASRQGDPAVDGPPKSHTPVENSPAPGPGVWRERLPSPSEPASALGPSSGATSSVAGQAPAFQPQPVAPPFNGRGPAPGQVPPQAYDQYAPQQSQFPPIAGPRPGWAQNPPPSHHGLTPNHQMPPAPSYNAPPPIQAGAFALWSQPTPENITGPGPLPAAAPSPAPNITGPRGDYTSAGHVSMAPTDSLAEQYNQQKYADVDKPKPQSGWRKGILKISGGLINPGESADERDDRLLREKIDDNIRGQFVFAVISVKGGVANTTTAAGIGSIFAETRGAEVIVMDINPDYGTLAKRVNPAAQHTFVDVLRDENIHGRTDVRSYTKHNAVKLDVLASSEALVEPPVHTPETLIKTVDRMRRAYSVIGLDCGKSINSPLMPAVLDMVNALVVVSSVASDSGRAALIVHDWLRAHGRSQLLERSFLLLSDQNPNPNPKVRGGIEDHVQKIIWKDPSYIPYDEHLREAAVINLHQLAKPTYRAYLNATGRLAQWYNMPPLPLQNGGYRP
ncbi:AAA family ATPase [Mycobacteroides abscessus]|uniref:AAA family ATPase n=1 Tax=Mycobacteroides abscessus TaxID=36809 RepID=UPI0013F6965D|nr:AAA family ATPase [Mycobacteroides abscessus]